MYVVLILEINFSDGYHCNKNIKLKNMNHFHSILILQKLDFSHLWHDLGLKTDSIF
jgi:hypothetical protein